MPYIFALIVGVVLGAVLAWLALKNRSSSRIAALEERVLAGDEAKSRLAERDRDAEQLRSDLIAVKTAAEKDREAANEKLALLEEAKERLSKEFENLANRIFEDRSSKLAGDHRERLGEVLKPFKDQLGDFRKRIDDIYSQEGQQRASLLQEIKQLKDLNNAIGKEAQDLTKALKGQSKTRGNWGELIVEKVLELSGLHEGREYESQKYLKDKHGGVQGRYPDFIVHLPENRDVVVDAKMALNAYDEYCSAEDESDRVAALKRHVDAVRGHMMDLASKNYEELAGINPLEQVIMCVPNEPAYITAVQEDISLHDDAFKRGILIVGPNTLVMTLKIVSAIWRTEDQNRNALDIAERGQLLYDKFVGFVEDLEGISAAITKANTVCEDARKKLTSGSGNLVGQAEKLIQLGVKAKKHLPREIIDESAAQLRAGDAEGGK